MRPSFIKLQNEPNATIIIIISIFTQITKLFDIKVIIKC